MNKIQLQGPVLAVIGFFALLFLSGCVQPFSPPEINSDQNHLVVDGFFNIGGTDTSRFELRRTQNVSEKSSPVIETGASIAVEEENGQTFDFAETGT